MAVLYDLFPSDYNTREPLHVYIDGLAVPLFIARFERRGKSGAVFVFDDIDNQERSRLVTGLEFYIRGDLADNTAREDGLSQFVGYTAVINEQGGGIGAITGIIASIDGNESNPLFNIETAGRQILVPAAGEMVTETDPRKRIIRLEVPEGLLDL